MKDFSVSLNLFCSLKILKLSVITWKKFRILKWKDEETNQKPKIDWVYLIFELNWIWEENWNGKWRFLFFWFYWISGLIYLLLIWICDLNEYKTVWFDLFFFHFQFKILSCFFCDFLKVLKWLKIWMKIEWILKRNWFLLLKINFIWKFDWWRIDEKYWVKMMILNVEYLLIKLMIKNMKFCEWNLMNFDDEFKWMKLDDLKMIKDVFI